MSSTNAESPGYFGPAARPLFGWLQAGGSGPGAGTGIVFCNPLAYESLSAHRTIRAAALRAASLGCATLRFDYDGSGDSAGCDTDANRVSAWLASIDHAAERLHAAAPITRLCMWGVRAGALLAATVAQRRTDVDALVLTAPVIAGTQYLREQRALVAASGRPQPVPAHPDDGLQEFAGYLSTQATREALATLDLRSGASPRVRRVLLQHRDDLPFSSDWLQRWQNAGIETHYAPFSGYEAMMRDAHRTELPLAMIDAALSWLTDAPAAGIADTAAAGHSRSSELITTVSLPVADDAAAGMVRESAVHIGGEPPCFAVISEPAAATTSAARPLLLLLNAGSVPHVGPNRLYVELARQLAQQDVSAVRIDLPGLGDSAAHAGEMPNHPYSAHVSEDLQRVLEVLQQRYQPASLHATGICSGAYHTLQLALADRGLRSATMINPLTFHWHAGMRITVPESKVIAEAARYQQRALSLSAWGKLLSGRVAFRTLTRILSRRLWQLLQHAARGVGRTLGIGAASRLERALRSIAARGGQLRFVFADSDPGLILLREQGGRAVAELESAQRLSIEVISNADHTFTTLLPRRQLLESLSAWMRAQAKARES